MNLNTNSRKYFRADVIETIGTDILMLEGGRIRQNKPIAELLERRTSFKLRVCSSTAATASEIDAIVRSQFHSCQSKVMNLLLY